MSPAEIEGMERATVEAVAPDEIAQVGDWLVPLGRHPMGRGRSAVPLRHDAEPSGLGPVFNLFQGRGVQPQFRLADVSGLDRLRTVLMGRGFDPVTPTAVEIGSARRLAETSKGPVRIEAEPGPGWDSVFAGEGFNAQDGLERLGRLARSPGAVFASAGAGVAEAVGVASFGQGWAGIHGMRTAPAARGKGLATAILAALGREILARGYDRVVLQVTVDNSARRIYRRAGFQQAWTYSYWQPEGEA